MKILKATVLFLIFSLLVHTQSFSQIIAPTGITSRATSQLVFYYDNYANDPFVQITNTDDTTGVWIHVQIFRSNDDSATEVPIICDERDFIDFLTPNDTHMYDLGIANFPKNTGEAETTPGELTSVDLSEPDNTAGFILITPVVSEADLSAISFQHLIGSATDESFGYRLNAMGRDAVDFTTGEILPDGTVLDGVTGGLVVIQPEELLFDFLTFSSTEEADVIGIAFQDNYGAPGLLGYNVTPASATWTSFIFDFKEDPTSCGNRNVNCFLSIGLNDTITENSEVVDGGTSDDFVLCSGAETPDSSSDFNNPVGWTRIFVSGLGDFVSHFGIYSDAADVEGADHMFARGSRTEINPPPTDEICDDEAMADEDGDGFANCLDTDCATAANCETGEGQCADQMDNDNDGQTDCADLGCDGFDNCEFGTETLCNDGIDNDADGAVDGDDSDCQAAETTGGTTGGGGGGGCVVAGSVSAATAAANMLLPLLPLFGAYGIRRKIRK